AQRHLMAFAGMAAVQIACPAGQEPAENAVFGVEYWQMVIDDDFKALAADFSRQRADLIGVQVVRRGDSIQTELKIGVGRKLMGCGEAEIPDERVLALTLQRLQQTAGANENRAVQPQQKIDHPLFLRFEHARAGDARRDSSVSDLLHRRAQAIEIEI